MLDKIERGLQKIIELPISGSKIDYAVMKRKALESVAESAINEIVPKSYIITTDKVYYSTHAAALNYVSRLLEDEIGKFCESNGYTVSGGGPVEVNFREAADGEGKSFNVLAVTDPAAELKPVLTAMPARRKYPLLLTKTRIGRAADNDLVITNDMAVSGHHAVLERRDNRLFVIDAGSKNGVVVNYQRCFGEFLLKSGDILQIGRTTFLLALENGEA
jgi:hypothetical protein